MIEPRKKRREQLAEAIQKAEGNIAWAKQSRATTRGPRARREREGVVKELGSSRAHRGEAVSGAREVRAPANTCDAGEATRATLRREGGRRGTEPSEGKMAETSGSETVSTKLARIADLARRMPDKPLTTLAHHIDLDWMREAYRRTRKDGAVGVDGQTAEMFAANLEGNLQSLLERAKRGDDYRAPPVRRVYIPKGDGSEQRPIGIPTFEDKVLQRAVAMVLEAVYEQDFLDCSYGFRPGRSAHDALRVVQNRLMNFGGGWVLDADISNFFETIVHAQLREMLSQRVRDGVLLRLVGKWLNAGVLEAGEHRHSETGSPQGGVISPILANVYLHEVLDRWFEREVKPRLGGRAMMVRYADDAVFVFEREDDARRVWKVMGERLAKYGLTLHPDKTRLVDMRHPETRPPSDKGGGGGTFNMLGFTHSWGLSKRQKWMVIQRTATERLSRALRRIRAWCRQHRHDEVSEQAEALAAKLRGHFNYYGLWSNWYALHQFRTETVRAWRKWLDRRSGSAHMIWEKMNRLLRHHVLPPVRITHPLFASRSKPVP